jgi:hypothetical protein
MPTDRLTTLITTVRRRWLLTVALRTVGIAMSVAAVPVLAAALAYWLFASSGAGLLILAGAAALLSLAGVAVVLARIERRPDDLRVARFIEERAQAIPGHPSMDDCVVSAVQASGASAPGDGRTPFTALVVGSALRRLEGIEAVMVIPPARVRRAAAVAAGGATLLIVALTAGLPGLSHAYETARLRLFPGSISVDVQPGDLRIVAGRPLTIHARVQADGAAFGRSSPTLTVTAGDQSRVVDMTAAGDGFEFRFESVDRTFDYAVSAGAVASRTYTVTALFRPRVQRIDIQYQYPSFSGLSPRTEEDGGDIYAPAGTRVRLAIHTDKPIAAGQLAMSGGASMLTSAGDQVLQAELVLSKDDSYRVRLTDRDGLASDDDSEYFIRLMDDRPPDVRILRPTADQGITPLEEVAIEARAEDDYGIASLDLVYAVGGGPEHTVPFRQIVGGDTQRTGAYLLAAEDLKVKPGDVITYYARARDVGRGKRSTETQSDIFFLEVRPFNEEFVAALSQAGARGGGDQQLDSLIAAQKEIISATWNIERRAAGGRSAADIRAVAQAQAELKARAERALGGGRPPLRDFVPQQVGRRPQAPARNDGVAAAVEAMTKALEQLASEKTREAISHEMAALNGLLQAQAEVRRREIQQQANNAGGGGSNRQSQDLSALFDKELQRQQRTNYEQRSQIEERPEQAQTNQDALDRIRDLARRQEALNQRQRELERLAEEARKRELAKLTRDQQELQRQAEDLSRQVGQQSSQPQGQKGQQGRQQGQRQGQQGQSPQGQGGSGIRSAAEQMRQAAGDLQRNDGQSAAQSGERAASQLRRLEEQMRGNSADARQRAAADLQAEAQQIAQEQRRIAAEAGRLEKATGADTNDARRRLAADKDRLADRVEGLERQAGRLGQQGKGEEQNRAREAAGQLERGRVGETMREGAQQMREGAKPPSGQAEQQLAKALEQVVEQLGGGVSSDTRQMAEQLDRSRETREKLDQLEAQMKAAQGKPGGAFDKLREQYEQALRATRQTLGRQPTEAQRDARGGATPETQQLSGSAPGTEAFKQDRSGWESLRKSVDRALEEHDAAVSRRLAKALGENGLSAGGSQRVPEQYRHLVAKYYESLAKVKK